MERWVGNRSVKCLSRSVISEGETQSGGNKRTVGDPRKQKPAQEAYRPFTSRPQPRSEERRQQDQKSRAGWQKESEEGRKRQPGQQM